MNQNNISSAMDNLSRILGYTAPADENGAAEEDVYLRAAKRIKEHVESNGFEYKASENELQDLYDLFKASFAPELLAAIPDEELLKKLFYSADGENDCLCYMLEFHPQMREHFGSVAGGSSYKFGLFQKKETGVWISGSPRNPEELDVSDAIERGKEIRNAIVQGASIIASSAPLLTVADYEKLDAALNSAMGKYASLGWVHKYFHMIFPDMFPVWHMPDWHIHMLLAYGIKPSDTYYGRSGQLAIIAKKAEQSAAFFGHASYDLFGNIKRFCRIGTSDNNANYAREWAQKGIVAIGWGDLGDIAGYVQGDSVNRSALQSALADSYYSSDARTASRKANEIATFLQANTDTIFVAMDGEQLLALCDKVGNYYYDSTQAFSHCKAAEWHHMFAENAKLPNKAEGLRTSCVTLKDIENLLFLYDAYYNGIEIESEDSAEKEDVAMAEHSPRINPLYPLNQIIYGAPGTGKTYSSIEYAVGIIESVPFKLSKTPEERKMVMEKYQNYVNCGQIVFTTFHQSYGYEEFIQGIRPQPAGDKISFHIADGVFKKIADEAMKHAENNYVIIIDEINRGNISKIFGELITLIESDKRWGELNQMAATLPLGKQFSVPNNLYIIGTMNTADKSISLIDVALRRRFEFVGMYPDLSVIADETLRKVLDKLNKYLRVEMRGTDLLIGHSFFIGKSIDDLGGIMNQNIIPLLYEYFFDEEVKIKKALECIADTGYTIDGSFVGRIRIVRNGDN